MRRSGAKKYGRNANVLLHEEADRLTNVWRWDRTEGCKDTCASNDRRVVGIFLMADQR